MIIGRGMYGLWGPLTDPGEREFSAKVAALGVDVGNSPYRDYEVDQIAADVDAAPPDAIRLLWGSSLGACNCPVVASRTKAVINGMWGFQASLGGEQMPIPDNVLFAHEVWNPNIWLGGYEWQLAAGNHRTNLYTSKRYDFHPGETEAAQAMFLAEMRRVIGRPVDLAAAATQGDYTAVANALVKLILAEEQQLPGWEQAWIPQDKIPAAAGAAAKVAVDALDAYRATRSKPT